MYIERIPLATEEPFRLVAWKRDSERLTVIGPRGKVSKARGAGSQWHSHPEVELTIVTAGLGMRYVGDHAAAFEAGDCVLLGSHLPHCWVNSTAYSGYVVQVGSLLAQQTPGERPGQLLRELFESAHCGVWYPREVATELVNLIERMRAADSILRFGLLFELFGRLHEAMPTEAKPLSSRGLRYSPRSGADRQIQEAAQWILDHYQQPISVQEIMKLCSMSRATLSRRFKQSTGQSIFEFIIRVRLAAAHRELTSTRTSITEIAYDSGFGSLSHFNAMFRERYGANPREIRAAHADKSGQVPDHNF